MSRKQRGLDVESLLIDELHVDPQNPRLPEGVRGESEWTVIKYLYENMALDELAASFLDNGYLPFEPLIVEEREGTDGYVVLEGNRRLATLKILQRAPEAGDLEFDISQSQSARDSVSGLERIPCVKATDRAPVDAHLGYRHIGGLKSWSPEAKARYVTDAVDKAAAAGDASPFKSVGRSFGSNAQGMRNSYVALAMLRHARNEFGIDVAHVMNERFGVWMRCLNVPGIREHVGYGAPPEYSQIRAALAKMHQQPLSEVIDDLTPKTGRDALVDDSRDVSRYGRILQSPKALRVLRKRQNFDLAVDIVERMALPDRIRKERDRCEVLLAEVQTMDPIDSATVDAIVDLFGVVRSMHGLTKP